MSQTYTQMAPLMLGLLEILAAKNGCMYLSDLAGKGRSAVLSHHLWKIDANAYSLREWEDAVHYLTGEIRAFSSQEEAKEYLAGPVPGSDEL